ncbi:MAG: 2-hydroxyacyl-CoA dehydratase [Candidatus Rokubacteria bacterium]|nr:2-hydroxyacyl-CoA dehydratase [Candidatus Rokubacteria bacterium]
MPEVDLKVIQKKVTAGASYRKLVAAAEAGQPICVACAGIPNEVMHAMGVFPIYPESLAAISSGIGKAAPFFDESRARALSNVICSYTRCGLGICWTGQSAFGPLPPPAIAIADVNICSLHLTWWRYMEEHFRLPTFYMDMPATDDPGAPEYIDYYEQQIHEMVTFLEANTPCRLGTDKLRDSVANSDRAGLAWKKIMELRRNRPSPVSFRALAGQILPMVISLGDQDAADYYEALHDQYVQDANDGKTPARGGERYRLIWNGIPIWHHLQLINYFEEKGANFVWEPYTSLNWGNKTSTGRLDVDRPFHTLAEKYTNVITNKPIAKRFEYFDRAIREYAVDGLVMFSNRSCRPMSIGQHELIELIQARHGLPVLVFEGDQADAEGFSWDDARMRIDGFIEVLEGRKA